MKEFRVGYAEVNINPPLGIGIRGYYVPRFAKGFLDDLKAQALVLELEDTRVALISLDNCAIHARLAARYCAAVEKATGIPKENVWISASHTHTGPLLQRTDHFDADETLIGQYVDFLESRLKDLVALALEDRKPAVMGIGTGRAPERVAYIRLYKMKDGSTMTCPPINDPGIDHPIGQLDQRVHILRFDREDAPGIVLVNYGLHADTIGGELISPDWPGWMRKTVENALDGVKCICFVGCEGDVGSTNVFPSGGDMNDTQISFDNEMKSPGMARFVGRALAGTVLQVYDKAEYVAVEALQALHRTVEVASNRPSAEELPLAHRYRQLHEAGRDAEIPFTGMELTTVVGEALLKCQLEHGPDQFAMELMGVKIGPVAMVGFPGEPFTDIGVQLKQTQGWKMILPCCLVKGNEGYFPTKEAFAAGGYETRTSLFRDGVAETLITESKALLEKLKQS